jgi:hypothetical protein
MEVLVSFPGMSAFVFFLTEREKKGILLTGLTFQYNIDVSGSSGLGLDFDTRLTLLTSIYLSFRSDASLPHLVVSSSLLPESCRNTQFRLSKYAGFI